MSWLIYSAHAALILVAWWLVKVISVLHSTRGQPGFVALIKPYSEFGQVFFPSHFRFNLTVSCMWTLKTDLYRKYNSNVLVVPSLFPPVVTFLIADAQAIQQINHDHQHFVKDPESNGSAANLFGPSVLTVEGNEWKRHRRVVMSGFSERNNSALWDATIDYVGRWIEEMGKRAQEEGNEGVLITNSERVWGRLALLVMGRAGFGIEFGWPESLTSNSEDPNSSTSSFYAASSSILKNWVPLAFLPQIFPFTTYFTEAISGKEMFEKQLREIVAKRVEEVKTIEKEEDDDHKKQNILSLLCRANALEEAKTRLSDQELFSDAFIFLIAGHETTAGTIAAVFAFLAIYPQWQEAISKEVSTHLESNSSTSFRSLSYSSFRSLPVTLAVIQETLRLAGPVQVLLKKSIAPTILPSKKVAKDGSSEEGNPVPVPTHAQLREHVQGVHYLNWEDACAFKPERFLEMDKENQSESMKAFLPFNSGPRGCPGRQFALVESVALVASVLHKFKVEPPASEKEEWELKEGESENERHDRILKPLNIFLLRPHDINLVFVPRD